MSNNRLMNSIEFFCFFWVMFYYANEPSHLHYMFWCHHFAVCCLLCSPVSGCLDVATGLMVLMVHLWPDLFT